MLMEIDPLPMRGLLVMTMVMISPSWREVSLAEQLRRSPRLVPPRFLLVAAEFLPVILLIIFSSTKDPIQPKMGIRGPPGGPRGKGRAQGGRARPPPSWTVGGPPLVLSSPNSFYIFQNRLSWSFRTFGDVQNRSLIFAPFPAQNPSCRHLPLYVNLVK